MTDEPQIQKPDNVHGVLFDLDGVLINSARAWHQVVNIGALRFGGQEISFDFFEETFGQGPDADQIAYFPQATLRNVESFYLKTFPTQLSRIDIMHGANDLLDTLRQRGIKIGVVTNTPATLARIVLQHTGLDTRIDTHCAAGDAPEKPAPDLIHLALEKLSLSKENTVYIGDSDSDRGATSAAGVYMIGLNHPGDTQIASLPEAIKAIF